MRRPRVTLYTRAGCHLCWSAERLLRAEGERRNFALEIVDVDTEPALADRYGVRVPVVAIDGVERFELEVPPERLRSALRWARLV